jgi:predicted ATP-dependent endonuclease of OLD family
VLRSLQFSNFRGFRDHTIDLTPFCLLIGENNAGKTTIIEALRLVATALRRARTANFQMAPRWLENYLSGPVFRFSVETIGIEHRSIHYNYNADEPAIIRARFANNSIVAIAVGSEETEFFCQLLLPGGKKINGRAHVNDRRFPPVNVMPPVGSLLDRETRRDAAYMRKHIDGYLAYRHIRNQMSSMPDQYDEFRDRLEATWEHLQLGEIEYGLGEKRDEFGITVRDGPFVSEMGLVGSGLQAWIQTIWFLSRISPRSTIVLDEPDIYLHADLQRKLIKLLASGDYVQTIIATHSLEMISAVAANEIISVTKRDARSRALTSTAEAQALADRLGTSHNLQLSKLAKTGRVLFVEGKDHAFLDQFAFKLGNALYDRFSHVPHFAVGGMSNWRRAAMAAEAFHETSGGRVASLLLLDRDYKPEEHLDHIRTEAAKQHLAVHFWNRKEIENYVICSRTLADFLSNRTEADIDQQMIGDLIDEVVGEVGKEIVELIADSYQAADRKLDVKTVMSRARRYVAEREAQGSKLADLVPGKKVLSVLSARCKDRLGVSFSPITLCRQMKAQDVPEEINDFLGKLL